MSSRKSISVWKIFKETAEEYVHNSNVPGYKYLMCQNHLKRYFWYAVHIFTLATTFFTIKYTWDNFTVNPTITTVDSLYYPITEVPMPGISVCNINKISRVRAEAYAEKLSNRSGKAKDEILQGIELLGRLYDYNMSENKDDPFLFQDFLDKYDPESNTYERLQMLIKPCHDLLTECKWHNKNIKCGDLFVTELTMEGHCCVFNYVSQSSSSMSKILRDNNNKSLLADNLKEEGGLAFKLLFNKSDYMSKTISTSGVKILISLPSDFPDTTSGGLIEVIVEIGVKAFLALSSITTFTTPEVKKYSIDKRGCIFRDETNTIFGSYSYSDCIMDCKIKSIDALCQCTPFNYLKLFQNRSFSECTLADLRCLSLYTGKWRTLYPTDYVGSDLDKEKQDSTVCSNCIPACSDTSYSVKSDSVEIYKNGKKVESYSIVRIFFENAVGTSSKQDVFFYWYDIVGLLGGLCSLIMGISFISVVELFYFLIYVFCKKMLKSPRFSS